MKAKVPAWIRSDQTLMIRLFAPNAAAYLTSFAIRISIAKLILHQDGHNYIFGLNIGDRLYDEIMNRWLCHYLYGVENGAEDMPELSVQSNVDGSFAFYDTFPDTESIELLSDGRQR